MSQHAAVCDMFDSLQGSGGPRLLLSAHVHKMLTWYYGTAEHVGDPDSMLDKYEQHFVARVLTSENLQYALGAATVTRGMLSPNVYHTLPDIRMTATLCVDGSTLCYVGQYIKTRQNRVQFATGWMRPCMPRCM